MEGSALWAATGTKSTALAPSSLKSFVKKTIFEFHRIIPNPPTPTSLETAPAIPLRRSESYNDPVIATPSKTPPAPLEFESLSQSAAETRRRAEGPNELPSSHRRGWVVLALDVFREPMFLLLVACGALYFALGDGQEAAMLLGFVFFIMGITLFQEGKTERALEALRDLSSPRALVIRDGSQRRVAGRDVVRGDLLVLAEGDRVPADGILLSSSHLAVDESLLTGESVSVRKEVRAAIPGETPTTSGDGSPYVFAGTLVVQGQGLVRVTGVGAATEIGKIGRALEGAESGLSPLQIEMAALVKVVAVVGAILCAAVVLVTGFWRGAWLTGVLAGLSLAMALMPNEFPVVLTIFLSLGAWRLSKRGVLARRMPAVEALGAVTVLCVDKTGTLTENRMDIQRLLPGDLRFDISPAGNTLEEAFHEILEFGILASARNPFDPMEKAFHALGDRFLARTEHLHGDWTLVKEYPLSRELLAMSQVWTSPDQKRFVIAAKGAPEAVADLCHFPPDRLEALRRKVDEHAREGYRLLGVAKSSFTAEVLPDLQHDFDFEFLGLIALADPVRRDVPAAIEECRRAGVRVAMITGDYPGTAQSVARAIGLSNADRVLTGPEIDALSEEALAERLRRVNVFARAVPEHKLRLIRALRANGEIVAMTGDGVNDAPALKAAHIGVAMGERGTDVAREAAGLVLLHDDFASLVGSIAGGRRVFDNLKKGMAYILAIHVPIAGLSLASVFLGWPLVLLPIHIAFLHLVIDPACSVAFEAEPPEPDAMQRPPRKTTDRLFGWDTLGPSLAQGVSVFAAVFAVFALALRRGQGELDARALAFTTLMAANAGLILANRSWTQSTWARWRAPNRALWAVVGGSALFLAVVLSTPLLRRLFHFSTLHTIDIAASVAVGTFSVFLVDWTAKRWARRRP